MMSAPEPADGPRITLTQLPSSRDREGNLRAALSVIDAAGEAGTDLVLLPENCLFCGTNAEMREAALTLDSPEIETLRDRARRWATPVILGGFKHRTASGAIYNTALVIGPDGEVVGGYDKIHLFNASVGGVTYQASSVETAGDAPVMLALGKAKIGLTICFDLRFPELYRSLALAGAILLVVPSAFTRTTGEAHWEILLRARAIENAAYVIASATIGGSADTPADATNTYGHALAVDPWGRVLADLGQDTIAWRTIALDLDRVAAIRSSLAVLSQVSAASAAPARWLEIAASGGTQERRV
jgi:predicted amidohydrolase